MTPMWSPRQLVVLLIGLTATHAVLAADPSAPESQNPLDKIVELNKRALLAYDSLEMEAAKTLLRQALDIIKRDGLENHPTAARTHLHLGVVYIGGLKYPELGLAEFREALTIDPKIQIPKSLANPEVQAAFEEALWWETSPGGAGKRLPFPTGQEPGALPAAEAGPGADRINHPAVTRSQQGAAIEIKAQVAPGMGAAKVVLAYMAQDASDFLAREMSPIATMPGWYREAIPAEATRGAWVAYYIEAQDAEDQPLVRAGTPESPYQITLVRETRDDGSGPGSTANKVRTRAVGRGIWFVFAIGSGGGYHNGSPEMNQRDAYGRAIDTSGFGFAQLLHLAPEIGFFQSDHLVLSAQGRFQYVTGPEDVHIGVKTYHPAVLAYAGLAKATWLAPRPGRKLQPFASVEVGAGQIRHAVTTPASVHLTGCGAGPTCQDTALGGMALVGAGAGFRYRLGEGTGFYLAVNVLAGMPHIMVNADLNVGVVVVR
jgi:hypothetical protein